MFVAMLSSTVVTNALPAIVTDLHGSQTGYTWVVVATLLTMTASTPIWGKLADLFDRKLLLQLALVIFVVAGIFFVIPLYLSVALGLSAIETGVRLLVGKEGAEPAELVAEKMLVATGRAACGRGATR